ncbi:hypothetical protein Hanom_Chr03g00230211 [Helianthus anomalus]
MYHVVALIAERQKGTCTNRSLSRLLSVMCLMSKASCKTTIEPGVSLEAVSLVLKGRGKVVYILPSLDPTFALLLCYWWDLLTMMMMIFKQVTRHLILCGHVFLFL